MTTRRKNQAFSLFFTLLVCAAVFLAYQSRETSSAQTAPAQADMLLADGATEADFRSDRSQVVQPLPAESSAAQDSADGQPSSNQSFADDGNLVTNGGFERPELTAAGFATPPGWASRERQLEFWVDGHLGIPAEEGGQFIELNGRTAGRIAQDVEVEPDTAYRWSFAHRARNDQDTVKAFIDGELVTDATSLPGQWRTASGIFLTDPGQTVVTFSIEAVDDGEFGNFIDNVRVEVQPGL
ncbi:MAG: hypothetical protein AAF531_16135 [Actinomycetota bacterium]